MPNALNKYRPTIAFRLTASFFGKPTTNITSSTPEILNNLKQQISKIINSPYEARKDDGRAGLYHDVSRMLYETISNTPEAQDNITAECLSQTLCQTPTYNQSTPRAKGQAINILREKLKEVLQVVSFQTDLEQAIDRERTDTLKNDTIYKHVNGMLNDTIKALGRYRGAFTQDGMVGIMEKTKEYRSGSDEAKTQADQMLKSAYSYVLDSYLGWQQNEQEHDADNNIGALDI